MGKKQEPILLAQNSNISKDNPKYIYEQAEKYRMGNGIKKDYYKAFEYYKKASELGVVNAYWNLFEMYSQGLGVEKNQKEANQSLFMAASLGHDEAQLITTSMLMKTNKLRTFPKAVTWINELATKGRPEAQLMIATMYITGNGVNQNIPEAIKWLKKGAERGEKNSQKLLGDCYKAAKNYEEARKWYSIAAAQGDKSAQDSLENLNN